MKLVFISDTPNPRMVGGGEYAIYKYAEGLALLGHHVVVYGQFHRPFMSALRTDAGMRVRLRGGVERDFRGAGQLNRWWDRIHTQWIALPGLRRMGGIDAIIGYQRRSSIKARQLGEALGDIPVMHIAFEPPTAMEAALGEQYTRVMTGRLAMEWEGVREAYRSSAGLFPLSRVVGEAVASWCGKACSAPVYAGVDAPSGVMEIEAREDFILYLGRLDSTKNVHDLIDAMALLKKAPPLVIVGRGYDEHELKARAAAAGIDCRFMGLVSDVEKWRLVRQCLFLVFPTSVEGFGMPPGEALSCGKPAVCSDIPILREVYGDAVEYFPVRQVGLLAEVMQRLLADRALRHDLGARGRDYVMARYQWAHCAARLEAGLLGGDIKRCAAS